MNDIQSLTIDEFNKQMRQPTLHPQVAVIDPGHRTYDPEDTEVRSARPPAILLKRRCAE